MGSCTSNAIAAAVSYEEALYNNVRFNPSRLFIYYNERLMEGNTLYDNGSCISDGILAI